MKLLFLTSIAGLILIAFFEYLGIIFSLLSGAGDIQVAIGVLLIFLLLPIGYMLYKIGRKLL